MRQDFIKLVFPQEKNTGKFLTHPFFQNKIFVIIKGKVSYISFCITRNGIMIFQKFISPIMQFFFCKVMLQILYADCWHVSFLLQMKFCCLDSFSDITCNDVTGFLHQKKLCVVFMWNIYETHHVRSLGGLSWMTYNIP